MRNRSDLDRLNYQTASKNLSRLNGIAIIFEYEVDAEGNTQFKGWEWKSKALHLHQISRFQTISNKVPAGRRRFRQRAHVEGPAKTMQQLGLGLHVLPAEIPLALALTLVILYMLPRLT